MANPKFDNYKIVTRNSRTLDDFVQYCEDHPEERFWQALLNWSGKGFIVFSDTPPGYLTVVDQTTGRTVILEDSYFREGK